ncbi:AAA family ATPase [Myroides sp. N17-2]|uniref:AAA family ATPase n=1 Tax=Myroides sp. N17-2 TaxID=2030799 RepID=UPI000EFCAA6B|nr:AAA family ATPase [Myroides sp. N17-2]
MESKERISIKNFAGIEELEMDIKPINILIGPQGVGKSVVVKLIYFFRDIINDFYLKNLYSIESIDEFKDGLNTKFFEIFDCCAFCSKKEAVISYEKNGEILYVIKGSNKEDFELSFYNNMIKLINEVFLLDDELKYHQLNNGISEKLWIRNSNLQEKVKNKIFRIVGYNYTPQFFIPAGRSFFSTIDTNIYSIIGKNSNNLDYFMIHFGQLYTFFKQMCKDNEGNSDLFDNALKSIIGGDYFFDEDKIQYIIHNDDRRVEIRNTSSGQQEALPLILGLSSIYYKKISNDKSTLYIEEPEAHLFPTAQKAIVELLAKTYNSNPDNTQLFITTHSPYILTSFNNLIYAGNIIKDDESKREAVEKVIAKDTLLDCSQIGAYALTKDGLKDLIDQENHIINAELLDEVSNLIGREFDQLLDIEYAE